MMKKMLTTMMVVLVAIVLVGCHNKVAETEVAETEVAETEVAETEVAETEVAETEVAETEHNYYAQTTVVVELNEKDDEVICVDFNGEEWVFTGLEDWMVGDYASMVMDDMGTELIFDDEIVSVRYDGWLDGNFGYDYESGQEVMSMNH